jgi:hypothetical protein
MAQLTETQRESLVFRLIDAERRVREITHELQHKKDDFIELTKLDYSMIINEMKFIKNCLIKNQLI